MIVSQIVQVFVCRSGSAADTQAITAYVQYYLHQHQMELNDEILVKTAASFATKLVYSNKASVSFYFLHLLPTRSATALGRAVRLQRGPGLHGRLGSA